MTGQRQYDLGGNFCAIIGGKLVNTRSILDKSLIAPKGLRVACVNCWSVNSVNRSMQDSQCVTSMVSDLASFPVSTQYTPSPLAQRLTSPPMTVVALSSLATLLVIFVIIDLCARWPSAGSKCIPMMSGPPLFPLSSM